MLKRSLNRLFCMTTVFNRQFFKKTVQNWLSSVTGPARESWGPGEDCRGHSKSPQFI